VHSGGQQADGKWVKVPRSVCAQQAFMIKIDLISQDRLTPRSPDTSSLGGLDQDAAEDVAMT
jgi:hypothetical protein